MKKKTIMCVAALIVAAIVSVTVVSCKKESLASLQKQDNPTKEFFNPQEIEDMNAYLKDFKQKMIESKADESLGIDEAAWHLSSLFNYDFANANVECDDVRFDTIYNTVTVTDGSIQLSDLAQVYEKAGIDIDKFYHSLNVGNKHFRFIGVSISETGIVTVSLVTTFSYFSKYWGDTLYYFPNQAYAEAFCDSIFNDSLPYNANGYGMTELERVLNLIESHSIDPMSHRTYYTLQSERSFYYRNHIDPFGSPYVGNSRLFATLGYYYDTIPRDYMCYLLDSYLGLGYQYCPNDNDPVYWSISFEQGDMDAPPVGHHYLTVGYGKKNIAQEQIEY